MNSNRMVRSRRSNILKAAMVASLVMMVTTMPNCHGEKITFGRILRQQAREEASNTEEGKRSPSRLQKRRETKSGKSGGSSRNSTGGKSGKGTGSKDARDGDSIKTERDPSEIATIVQAAYLAQTTSPHPSSSPSSSVPSLVPTVSVGPSSPPSTSTKPTLSAMPSNAPTVSTMPTRSSVPSTMPSATSSPSMNGTEVPTVLGILLEGTLPVEPPTNGETNGSTDGYYGMDSSLLLLLSIASSFVLFVGFI